MVNLKHLICIRQIKTTFFACLIHNFCYFFSIKAFADYFFLFLKFCLCLNSCLSWSVNSDIIVELEIISYTICSRRFSIVIKMGQDFLDSQYVCQITKKQKISVSISVASFTMCNERFPQLDACAIVFFHPDFLYIF